MSLKCHDGQVEKVCGHLKSNALYEQNHDPICRDFLFYPHRSGFPVFYTLLGIVLLFKWTDPRKVVRLIRHNLSTNAMLLTDTT